MLCLKGITNKDLLNSTGNSAQCHVAAWMGAEFGGEWIHVFVWLSPFHCSLETVTTLLISYTQVQNKKFNIKKSNVETFNVGPEKGLLFS